MNIIFATSMIQAARLSACERCEKFEADQGTCGICHCIMQFKVMAARSECPLLKWKAARSVDGGGTASAS